MRGVALLGVAAGCASPSKDSGPQVSDADGDGYTAAVDCDDEDGEIYPDAEDAFYDGIDSDCDGADDFDQDRDGHRAAAWGGDDCNDLDPMISPSAAETPYDGVDNDCSEATPDDDLDGDGFGVPGDCDDQDPAVHRGALERLGDAVDADCDGNPDGSRFGFADLQWTEPSPPRLAVAGDRVALVLTAAHVTSPTWLSSAEQVGVVVPLDPAGAGGAAPVAGPTIWAEGSDRIGAPDVQAEGGALWVGASWEAGGQGWLGLSRLVGSASGWQLDEPFAEPGVDPGLQVDVAVDEAGSAWLCGAGPTAVAYLRADGAPSRQAPADGAGGCAPHGAQLTSVDAAGQPTTWDADPQADPAPAPSADQPHADRRWVGVREADGVITAPVEGGGLAIVDADGVREVLTGLTVLDAQALVDEAGDLWIAAVADRGYGGEVLLAWGPPGDLRQSWLPVHHPGGASRLQATSVALALTSDRVALAVTGGDARLQAVGWVLLGR